MAEPSRDNGFNAAQVRLINNSYAQFLGQPLMVGFQGESALAEALFTAPFVVIAHDVASDPVFNYGNQMALSLFEVTWGELIRLPSRCSAEPVVQEERSDLLERVKKYGFIADYHGIRVSKTGRRFYIDKAVVWNLFDDRGIYHGQAACFKEWRFLD
ncbi:MAG: MEKHLA domain-containing protein [Methylococcales bacterium]|nr:MEKHLA domain-containing protein [Methylococcaceae bacterium]HIL40612.1 MEKHLA domain-containing protein [Methylococcales bacterium]